MNAPAFQFYADHYLADEKVQLMSLEEEGAYIRLLSYCWREGSIPACEIRLQRLCKNAPLEVIRVVTECFQPDANQPDRLIHKRLDEEREKQAVWRKKSSEGGKKSAEKRWNKDIKTPAKTKETQENNGGYSLVTPHLENGYKGGVTLQSTSTTTSTNNKRDINISFGDFWDLYDRKKGDKAKSEKKWNKLKDFEKQKIMLGLAAFVGEYSGERKQYQPYPETFLNQKRWNDDGFGIEIPKPPTIPVKISHTALYGELITN